MARARRQRQDGPGRRRRWPRWAGGVLSIFFLIGLTAMLCVDWATRYFFYPSREHVGSPAEAGLFYDLVTIPAEDGAPLEAWYFPARMADGGKPQALVVHAHGNAGNLSNHWPAAAGLVQRGFDVLTFDYRGFGRSPGRATRSHAAADLRSVLDHASERARREGIPLVLVGQSMGA